MPNPPPSSPPESVRCIVCGSAQLAPFAALPPIPAHTNRIWPSRDSARAASRVKVELVHCADCGHIFNGGFDEDLVDYETDYENSQMFSARFRRYAEELAERLIATYDVRHKPVVEIGGGKGEFLRVVCDRGGNAGVSFDPSYRPGPDDELPRNIRFVQDFYTAKYAGEPASLVICRHVLEHFGRPRELLESVREAIGQRSDLIAYFEVPNAEYILRDKAYWELHYQHCSYFTRASLAAAFAYCGFEVREVGTGFGGQYLQIEAGAAKGSGRPAKPGIEPALRLPDAAYEGFGAGLEASAARWRETLARLRAAGKRVIAWGAGAKAVTFLNVVDPEGVAISHVVDINPRKVGRYIPGSGQEIVEPRAAQALKPDVILLMNGIYRDEIASSARELGLRPEFLAA